MKFNMCPSCYTDVPDRATSCPRCGYGADKDKKISRKRDTIIAIGLFSIIAVTMVFGILLIDQIVGGKFNFTSSCGENEACLVTGLSVCNTVRATPQAFGIVAVEVQGKINGRCMVNVDLTTLDGFDSGSRVEKTCVFDDEQLPAVSVKDLYLCDDYTDKDEEYEENLISGAFVAPPEEDVFS